MPVYQIMAWVEPSVIYMTNLGQILKSLQPRNIMGVFLIQSDWRFKYKSKLFIWNYGLEVYAIFIFKESDYL